ncbi:hypothetical protein F0562_024733 [Nyssa sinensis]|uniref:Auxin-responsive protein n=1 Tax=Nyssa sinensis TaxID=561372 RepID=A0A5J5BCC8_9ASTE|nr:hypothetical protein F0562_024733 [Nyssa sinensis]
MEGCLRKDEGCPQLLDLIPKNTEWLVQRDEQRRSGSSEEKKLELRLGPPGEDSRERNESPLSLGYFSNKVSMTHTNNSGTKRGFIDTIDRKILNNNGGQTQNPVETALSSPWPSSFSQGKAPQCLPVMGKESSQPCCTKGVLDAKQKAFSPPSVNTAVPNSSQKRAALASASTAPAPVVGWPPIRSFRKNLASSSSAKMPPESQNVVPDKVASEKPVGGCRKGMFVKINMDGVPIGRKVDLKAYDSYEKLSYAVDELFRGLLAVQRDSSAVGIQNKQEEEKVITGLLDGSGEYTLVYEDNEGDRMLVGDVPWHMFVSTVKRLRVLKSSELSMLCLGSKQDKISLDAALK